MNKEMKKKSVIVSLLFLITSLAFSQNKVERLDSLFTELYKAKSFNGNVLIAENGNIIYQESFGLSDENSGKELNENSIFNLASLTKQFTAMAIVLLNKNGKLSYEDNITKYIPELDFYKGITIKSLLTHQSGLPDYMDVMDKEWNKNKIATNQDVIEIFQKIKPEILSKPNEKWHYSNTGYVLLASIIERVSNEKYSDFLQKNIFEPLNMSQTKVFFRYRENIDLPELTKSYVTDSLNRKVEPKNLKDYDYVTYLDGVYGQGRVYSTTSDLLKWDRALYSDLLISNKDRELIFKSYKTADERDTYYGFGWDIDNNKLYGKIVSHTGSWDGYITSIERHIDKDKTIILLQNNSDSKSYIPKDEIRRILYNRPIEHPIELSPDTLKDYAGVYLTKSGKESEIIFQDDKLYMPINSEVKLQMIPVSKTKFVVKGFRPEVTYEFFFDDNGNVEKYRTQQLETGVDRQALRKK